MKSRNVDLKSQFASPSILHALFISVLAWFCLIDYAASLDSPAFDPLAHTAASDVVYRWTVEDGLPINAVTDLVQDEAGFLWLATRAGLVRFDGLSFRTYNSQAFPDLPSDRLIHLYQLPNQQLWIRSEQFFLIRFDGTEFTALDTWPDFAGAQVLISDQNSAGWLVLGLRDGLGLIDADGPQRILADTVNGISEDVIWPEPERIWAVVDRELLDIAINKDSVRIDQRWPIASRTLTLLQTDHELWIGTDAGLYRLDLPVEGQQRPIFQPEFGSADINSIEQHPEGGLLVDTGDEVWRLWRNPNVDSTDNRPGWQTEQLYTGLTWRKQTEFLVPFADTTGVHLGGGLVSVGPNQRQFDARIRAALLDRDGNTWLALHGLGLALYRPSSLRLLGIPEGLPGENIYPVFEASDDAIWIGTLQHGAVRIDPDPSAIEPFTHYQSDTLLAWTIAEFEDGIWLGGKPCRVVGDACIDKPLEDVDQFSETFAADPVSLLYRDRHNNGWLGTHFGGLYEKHGERWIRSPLMQDHWPITTPIRTAAEAPDGALWLGTSGNGLVRIADGDIAYFSTEHGLSSNLVRDLWFDAGGDLLIATENRGLCRLQSATGSVEPNVQCISTAQGLFSDSLHQIQADDYGRVWISTNRGIFWLDRIELDRVFNNDQARIRQTGTINASTGMRNSELNGGAFPSGLRDRRGRLWWPSQSGLVVFDPAPGQNPIPSPPVQGQVDEVIVGTERYATHQAVLSLPRGERSVQLALTAAAFTDPSNIQFRFRIPALDEDWIETGRSRLVGPLNLPPGMLEITTQARAGVGEWGMQSTIQLRVPRYWYEYRSVQLVLIGLMLGLAAWALRARDQARARRSIELEQTIKERTAELRRSQHETEQALKSVRRSAELRTELFANIGHELRTPLTLISGPMEDAIQGGHSIHGTDLEHMTRNTKRMQRLVNQILDLRQTDEPSYRLQRKNVDVVSELVMCCTSFSALTARKGQPLKLYSRLSEAQSELDRDAFEKIMVNLLSNAAKFSPVGTTVTVEASADAKKVLKITVQDQGPGVIIDDAEAIFERFYRTRSSREQAIEGTGIGLSLARQLARLHKGDIELVNPGGSGAIFALRLPTTQRLLDIERRAIDLSQGKTDLNAEGSNAAAKTSSMRKISADPLPSSGQPNSTEIEIGSLSLNGSRPCVLLVEDDPGLREYMVNCLNDRYVLLEASNGQKGLELAQTHRPDLIVTDVMMPEMDGFMLVRELRKKPRIATVPVLMLTALGASGEVEGLNCGADDYLSKPFNREQLRARIQARLSDRERILYAFEEWRKSVSEQADPASHDDANGTAAKRMHPLLEKARKQILRCMHDADYSVAQLADDLHLSRSQLHRKLTEQAGISPSQLLRDLRLEAAGELLNQGFPVLEVAIATGFSGATVFSRTFKSHYGCPPSRWKDTRVAK